MTTSDVREAALSLPLEDRARLARELLESLGDVEDAGAAEAWASAIERRVRGLHDGGVESVDGEDVHRAIRVRLANGRQ